MNITTWDPFRDFFLLNTPNVSHTRTERDEKWSPMVDIREMDAAFQVSAELPGVDKDDVAVSVEKGVLTIKGEKKVVEAAEDEQSHRVERVYGAFTRQFTLPDEVDTDNIEAAYKDGVLMLTIPKAN